MGLGKTFAASTIGSLKRLKRWLIICPDNARSVWRDDCVKWIYNAWPTAQVAVDFIDDPSPTTRQLRWVHPYRADHPERVHVKIVTWNTFINDWCTKTKVTGKKKPFIKFTPRLGYHIPEIVICDEARRIRSRDTQAFQVLDSFMNYYTPPFFYALTGTPGHEPKHFWTYLHLSNPKLFRSYWDFVRTFHQVDDGFWGMEVNEPRNLPAFHKLLNQYASIVKEEEVEGERPPLTRQLLEIDMDAHQSLHYQKLWDDMLTFVEEDDKLVFAQNTMTKLTRIRQLLVCPKILAPSLSYGAAIQDFIETASPEEGGHYVVFTPFTEAIPYFRELVTRSGSGVNVYELKGGMAINERDDAIRSFRDRGGVLFCSLLYAQAFSLEPATKAFFIGYDWDPDNNRQAEKRLHRLTTENPITAYYYTFRSTFDTRIAEIVNLKQQRVNVTLMTPQLQEILHEAKAGD